MDRVRELLADAMSLGAVGPPLGLSCQSAALFGAVQLI
jgi:hypothetical protein